MESMETAEAIESTVPSAKPDDYYRQARREVAGLVPESAARVLDVGCAEGILGAFLRERGVAHVAGVEYDPEVAQRARTRLSEVVCGDAETAALPFAAGAFDCIIFADVLEHLRDPLAAIRRYTAHLAPGGCLVASIPNVRHYSILSMLADGAWTYQDQGLMDRTHLRFFTLSEIRTLFDAAGFTIEALSVNLDPRYAEVKDPLADKPAVDLTFGRLTLRNLTQQDVAELFVVQYLVRARRAATPVAAASR
jgi:2-polyprenyl-3-methyl-5-hydroxy-6-metoxy-1,4-benzoquinol methylase